MIKCHIQEATRNFENMEVFFLKKIFYESWVIYLSFRLMTVITFTHCIAVIPRKVLKYVKMSSKVVLHVEVSGNVRLL
jgi:hypothetical protein